MGARPTFDPFLAILEEKFSLDTVTVGMHDAVLSPGIALGKG